VEGAYIETPARRPIVDHNKESNGFAAPLILRCRLIGVPTMSYNVRSSRFPVLSVRRAQRKSTPAHPLCPHPPSRRPRQALCSADIRTLQARTACGQGHRGASRRNSGYAVDHRRDRALAATTGFSRTSRYGIKTLAEPALRIPRRKQWWTAIPKLGQTSAQQIEAFFAAHPALTERARALIKSIGSPIVVPWENVRLPHEIDGSCGVFRAPRESCALDAKLDFGNATGLRASELVNVTLKDIRTDAQGDHWVELVGKGQKAGKVALPPLARAALERWLVERGLPVSPERWAPATALISDLNDVDAQGSSTVRLWTVLKRFFETTATLIEGEKPAFAVKLRLAGPHWMRHTHATHALMRGAQLTSVRDNLRHASISTTPTYLHSDEVERARQFRDAFKAA
jgi:integrase